jgi:hypothetical protein
MRSNSAEFRWQGSLPSLYVIDCATAHAPASYDRPIPLLGPGAVSSGDLGALRMTLHPRARTLGTSTATAFDARCPLDLDPGWSARYACADACRINDPHDTYPRRIRR